MMRTKLLLSGLFTALLCAVLLAVVSGRLPSPWDSGTAEARTAVLEGGVFAPIHGPAGPNAAASPDLISFQGRLTNPINGMPLIDNSYSIAFRVFDADTAGTEVWTETQTVTVAGGLFSVYLGSDTPFPAGAFDGTARYLEVQVAADPAMTPRLLFTSVAYAFHALAADVSKDLNCNGCVDSAEVQFNYAGSNVPGGPATDVVCADCITGGEAQFNYAGSTSEGGPASDVNCSNPVGCISSAEIGDGQVGSLDIGDNTVASQDIADGTITGTDVQDNQIGPADVQFNYAGSTTEGGAATDVACANPAGCVDSTDVQFNYAGSTSEGGPASDVACTNCIATGEIQDGQVGTLDITDNSVASTDIADNSITATDVQFNYAGSTSEGGAANDSQTLDGVDSGSFLRSDAADSYTGTALTVGPTSLLKYQNADAGNGLRLSANGGDGAQYIFFFDATETGQYLVWDDPNDAFFLSNDLHIAGNLFLGNGTSWVGGGPGTIATGAGNNLRVDNGGLCVDDGTGAECPVFPLPAVPAGDIQADGAITANAFDLAERFPVAGDALEPGDLVVLESGAQVRRSGGTPYDPRMAGVVSGDPGLVLGWETGGDAPVSLAGRVPLKVSLENGPIAAGDHLTSSTTPGRAMKATQPGATVGIALEPFDGSQGDTGEVLTFISLGDGVTAQVVRELQQRVGELESQQPGAISADSGIGATSLAALLLAAVAGAVLTSAATTWFVLKTARVARS